MKLLILQGIPGSGKTTWARDFIKDNSKTWVIVNKDSIRNMLGVYWMPEREKLINSLETNMVLNAFIEGYSVVLDATNLNPVTLDKWNMNIKHYNESTSDIDKQITVEYKMFYTDLETCIERDSLRQNPVGERVIKDFYYKYIKKERKEKILIDDRFIAKQNYDLPLTIICDIDGTLALMNSRNAFDDEKCIEDKLNTPVNNILCSHIELGYLIILLSGRQEKAREVTTQWLRNHGVRYDRLFMRSTGDTRKDSIVKKELYEKYIKNNYYVSFWLDDRNQVVDMVRKELGLLCLQVYYGDF